MNSDAPEWLIELCSNQMRLMSATPKSVADSVWWELQKRNDIKEEFRRWAKLGENA